jgi:hypothetical protein
MPTVRGRRRHEQDVAQDPGPTAEVGPRGVDEGNGVGTRSEPRKRRKPRASSPDGQRTKRTRGGGAGASQAPVIPEQLTAEIRYMIQLLELIAFNTAHTIASFDEYRDKFRAQWGRMP